MGIQSLFAGLLIRSLLEILFIVLSPLAAGYYATSENSEDGVPVIRPVINVYKSAIQS